MRHCTTNWSFIDDDGDTCDWISLKGNSDSGLKDEGESLELVTKKQEIRKRGPREDEDEVR